MTKVEIPLDEVIAEQRKTGKFTEKQLQDFRNAFLANKDDMASKAIRNLIRKEDVKAGVAKKWD